MVTGGSHLLAPADKVAVTVESEAGELAIGGVGADASTLSDFVGRMRNPDDPGKPQQANASGQEHTATVSTDPSANESGFVKHRKSQSALNGRTVGMTTSTLVGVG
jgi:hypothetical protein